MNHRISLMYERTACQRCSAERILGAPCAHCGLRPRSGEVNGAVVRRRQLARTLQVDPAPEPDAAHQGAHDDRFESVQILLRIFHQGLTEFTKLSEEWTDERTASLRQTFTSLSSYIAELDRAPRLRPSVSDIETAKRLATDVSSVFDLYTACMTASTPIEAQKLAIGAQNAIDRCSAVLDQAAFRSSVLSNLTRGNIYDEGGMNLLDAISTLRPGLSILELDRQGRQFATSAIGRPITRDGLGATFLVLDTLADCYFDPQTYARKLRIWGRLFNENYEKVADLLADHVFRSDLDHAREMALHLNLVLDRLHRTPLPEQVAISQLVTVYRDCLEVFGLPLLAFTLRATGRKSASYKVLRKKNVTELFSWCSEGPESAFLVEGFSRSLRNAASHAGALTVRTEGVRVMTGSVDETISTPAFVDQVFQFFESFQAFAFLIDEEVGYEETSSASPTSFLPPTASACFTLRSCGAIDPQHVERQSLEWTFSVATSPASPVLMCRSIAKHAPPDVTSIRLEARDSSAFTSVPVADLALATTEALDTPIGVVRLVANASNEQGWVLSGDRLRRWAANAVAKSDYESGGILVLKTFRRIAQQRGDHELVATLDAAVSALRHGLESLRGTAAARDYARLADYLKLPQPDAP